MDSPCSYGIGCARLRVIDPFNHRARGVEMKITRVGLDIAKQVFQVHGVDEHGKVRVRKQLARAKVLEFFAQLPPSLIGIEACASAHYWGRELTELGHTVKLMAAQFVVPYRKRGRNDANDAEAITLNSIAARISRRGAGGNYGLCVAPQCGFTCQEQPLRTTCLSGRDA